MLAAPTYLPHQSTDTQTPLAVLGNPDVPEAEDTSGDRMEVTFAAQRAESPPSTPVWLCPGSWAGCSAELLPRLGAGWGAQSGPGSTLLTTSPFPPRAGLNYSSEASFLFLLGWRGAGSARGRDGVFLLAALPTIGVTDTS